MNKKIVLLGLCLWAIGLTVIAQPTTRIKLTQLEQGKVGSSGAPGLMGLTNSSGDQRYVTYVKVSATCYTGTPAPTGNLTNLSQFVIKCGSDSIFYIDWQGRSIFLGTQAGGGGAAVNDDDWYKQSANLPPNNTEIGWRKGVTIVGNKGNQTASNGYIPLFQVNDSVTTNREVKALIIGGRDAYYSAKNSLNGSYVQLGISGQQGFLNFKTGESLTIASNVGNAERPSTGTSHVTISDLENTIRFWKYPQSRVDTNTIRNILYTDAQGALRSRPVADLASYVGGTIIADSVTIFGTGSRLAPVRVGLLDSLNLKQRGVNLKNIEGAQAPTKNVMVYNGSRWVPSTPDYGNVYKDSLAIRTLPIQETAKNAVVNAVSVINWDADSVANLVINLTKNTSLYAPERLRNGGQYTITVKQDNVGGWGLGFPANLQLDDLSGINTEAYSTSVLNCSSDGTNMYCSVKKYGQSEGYNLLTTYYDSLDLYLVPSDFGNQFRPNNPIDQTKGMALVTAYGQYVYQYTDPSRNAWLLNWNGAGGDSTHPKTRIVSGRIGWYFPLFHTAVIRSSKYYQKPASGDFSIGFWAKCDNDGAWQFFISSDIGGGAPGWSISRTAANKVRLIIQGAAGASVIDYTSTASLTISSGWTWIQVRRSGTTGSIKVGAATAETLTFSVVAGGNSTNDLVLGSYVGASNYFTGTIGNMYWFNRYVSDATMVRFRDYNPQVPNLSNMSCVIPGTFNLNKITGLDYDYDFSVPGKQYKDAGVTPVSVNGDNVRRIYSNAPSSIPKYLFSPGSAQDPVYNTSVQNGLAAGTFQSSDYMQQQSFTDLATILTQKTIFVVFKSTDTLNGCLLSNDETKRVRLGSRQTGNWYSPVNQTIYFEPLDSFRNAPTYNFTSVIRQQGWNIAEIRIKGGEVTFSVNGDYYNTASNTGFSIRDFYRLSTSETIRALVGNVGQFIAYNQWLTNAQSDLVNSYLGTKWNIPISKINYLPDEGRQTWIDNRYDPNIDYTGFPITLMRKDTLWLSWKTSSKHNDSFNAAQGSLIQGFNPRTFAAYGSPVKVFSDILTGTQLDHSTAAFNWLPDGRRIFSGSTYDAQASPGGRDTVYSVFRIESLAGVLGAETRVNHPNLDRFFATNERIIVDSSRWYMVGYGRKTSTAHYYVSLIKSTNSGVSWTEVAVWDGNVLFGGTDPEEPTIIKNTDGRWQLFYRDDVRQEVLLASTNNINVWNTSAGALTRVGPAVARPGVVEMSDKTLVLQTRWNVNDQTSRSVYYTSKDGGRTWIGPIDHDKFRMDAAGWQQMYGHPVDLGGGVCLLVWGAEAGNGTPSNGLIANISRKKIKP